MSNTFSRRHFLQYGMAAIAGGTALGGLPVHAAQAPAGTAAPQNDLVKGYCPFCQVRCTYHARVRNGKILELIGDRGNRWTGGACAPRACPSLSCSTAPTASCSPCSSRARNGKPSPTPRPWTSSWTSCARAAPSTATRSPSALPSPPPCGIAAKANSPRS